MLKRRCQPCSGCPRERSSSRSARALVDSPKCPRCSLVSVCLPDETNLERGVPVTSPADRRGSPATPLYVTTPQARVRKDGGRLVLEVDGQRVNSRRLIDVSQVAVYGNATVTSGALRACLEADIPVLWFSHGGWFAGHALPHGGSWCSAAWRRYAAHVSDDVAFSGGDDLGKIRNQRTMLRRLGPLSGGADADAEPLEEGGRVRCARETLVGWRVRRHARTSRRSRRCSSNPRLSRSSSRVVTSTTHRSGECRSLICVRPPGAGQHRRWWQQARPQVGLLHRPQFGRPSLAFGPGRRVSAARWRLDHTECLQQRRTSRQFFCDARGSRWAVAAGRRQVMSGYGRRMAHEIRHPEFGYSVTYAARSRCRQDCSLP